MSLAGWNDTHTHIDPPRLSLGKGATATQQSTSANQRQKSLNLSGASSV